VTVEAIAERIHRGTGLPELRWDTALIGHPACNRGTMLASAGARAVDVLSDRSLYERFLQEFRHVPFDRRDVPATARRVVGAALRRPYWLLRGGAFLLRKAWTLRRELLVGRRVSKMTFFIHNFMDAAALDEERIRNCSFMVMTGDGPVSMCAHNAHRDRYLLKPVSFGPGGHRTFDPRSGEVSQPTDSSHAG
jgi:hypothetical protein